MGTYYVNSGSGDDSTGAEDDPSRPFKTIGSAMFSASSDGDIVEITDQETYFESSNVSPKLLVRANNITITHTGSFSLGRPKIDAGGQSYVFDLDAKDDITLNGLHLTNTTISALQDNDGEGLTVTDCFFENVPRFGNANLAGTVSKPARIKQSAFMFNGGGSSTIPFTNNGVVEMENCFFSASNLGTNIARSYQLSATASFCTFFHQDYGPGNSFPVVRWGKVVNCVVTASVTNANSASIRGIAANEHSNNLVDVEGAAFRNFADNSNSSAGSGDITVAPTFVDGTSKGNTFSVVQNYALAEGSRGIDEGVAFNSIAVDIVGTFRPQGAGFDMGAFETIPPYWQDDDNPETFSQKFGSNAFEIRATANKLKTQRFPRASENRQAPYFITIPGVPTLRGKVTGGKPYKNET
jgi:hypothetical protein|tara:strand:- start:375 stop:1607 length:1233 start_codon:yes stop_codon:yes gene_type:complete